MTHGYEDDPVACPICAGMIHGGRIAIAKERYDHLIAQRDRARETAVRLEQELRNWHDSRYVR